jgi:hypothetical protein
VLWQVPLFEQNPPLVQMAILFGWLAGYPDHLRNKIPFDQEAKE